MTKKWSISLIALFMFVLSLTVGFYSTGNTLSDPGFGKPIAPCIPLDCCETPNGGTGVWIWDGGPTCFCSCTGGNVAGGFNPNPYNCLMECGEPQ
jgi:hypothetical protein